MHFYGCLFELERYDLKVLLGPKGWISAGLFGTISRKYDYNAFRHNAVGLMHKYAAAVTSSSHPQLQQNP